MKEVIVHMFIPGKDYFWKVNITTGIPSYFKLEFKWSIFIKKYLNNTYNDELYWDKNEMKNIYNDKYNFKILYGDNFYKFDVIQRKK
jgi:hypothetical protein